jgi:hypothetical protein
MNPSLYPGDAFWATVRVLEFGKHKYGKWGGWKAVDQAEERYTDAFFRHATELAERGMTARDICAAHNGNRPRDCGECSGLPVLAHAVCDAVFLLWFTCKTDPGQPWIAP